MKNLLSKSLTIFLFIVTLEISGCGSSKSNLESDISDSSTISDIEDSSSPDSINDQIIEIEQIRIFLKQKTEDLENWNLSPYYYSFEYGPTTSTISYFSYYGLDYVTNKNDMVENISFSKDKFNEIVSLILSNPISLYSYQTDESGKTLYSIDDYVMVLDVKGFEYERSHIIAINLPDNFNEILTKFDDMKNSAMEDIPSIDVELKDYALPEMIFKLKKSEDSDATHYFLATIVLSVDISTTSVDEDAITKQLTYIIESHTIDEMRDNESQILDEILHTLQRISSSDYLYSVRFEKKLYQ